MTSRLPDPAWFTELRAHQVTAIAQCLELFEELDVVFLDAPTGAGKTLIAYRVAQALGVDVLYTCSDKSLQDQFHADYPQSAVLKGKSNYTPVNAPRRASGEGAVKRGSRGDAWDQPVTCEDCTATRPDGSDCKYCPDYAACPYQQAKSDARSADVVVTNIAYALAEANYGGRDAVTSGRGLVILDEADTLESALMGFVEYTVPSWIMELLDITDPVKGARKGTIHKWLEDVTARATEVVDSGRHELLEDRKRRQFMSWRDDTRRVAKEIQRDIDAVAARKLAGDVERTDDETGEEYGHWIRDYDARSFTLKPVVVSGYGNRYLWRHGRKKLVMSATIISADEMAESLGLAEGTWGLVSVESTFPAENRPVIVAGVADMSWRGRKNGADDRMLYAIEQILAAHRGDRVLVHCVSYDLAKVLYYGLRDVCREMGREACVYFNARERADALASYKRGVGAVLFAPSMERGIDLPDDLCRVQVVAKMAFPNLKDRQVGTRMWMPGGKLWYAVQTVRKLVQMTGRGVRHERDTCTCLDPSTPVLTNDLRWVPVGELKVGDQMLGCDDEGSRIHPRKWRTATVEATGIAIAPRMKITLESGIELIATPNHRWQSRWAQARTNRWIRTDELRVGHQLNRYVDEWEQLDDYETGYLGGIIDGEGCLSTSLGSRNRDVTSIVITQNPGIVYDRTLAMLIKHFKVQEMRPDEKVWRMVIQGGFADHLRLMGMVRSERLIAKLVERSYGQLVKAISFDRVVAIEHIEDGPVCTLQSSTGNYVARGFMAHNTYVLDKMFVDSILRSNKSLLPRWWRDAMVMDSDNRWLYMPRDVERRVS